MLICLTVKLTYTSQRRGTCRLIGWTLDKTKSFHVHLSSRVNSLCGNLVKCSQEDGSCGQTGTAFSTLVTHKCRQKDGHKEVTWDKETSEGNSSVGLIEDWTHGW